jgi:hypothetical protein
LCGLLQVDPGSCGLDTDLVAKDILGPG